MAEHKNERAGEFLAAYDRYVGEHGDLYKHDLVPMSDDDRKKVKNVFVAFYGFLLFCTAGFFAMLYWKWPETLEDTIYAITMPVLIIAAGVWCYRARRKTLIENVKTSFRGIVTKKNESQSNYSFQLSKKEYARVTSIDFYNYTMGDIVTIEILDGPGFPIAYPKVTHFGNIYSQGPMVTPPAAEKKSAYWATAGRVFWKALKGG